VDGNKPLIYCSLGTVRCLTNKDYARFCRIVMEAAVLNPMHQWIVSIGEWIPWEDVTCAPPNVIIVRNAPQLQILEKATIMITHGGGNTVKECLFFGVPMILFPLEFDNPGNAARAVAHGVGVIGGDIRTICARTLNSLVSQIEKDAFYRMQAKLFARTFRLHETAGRGIDLIESILREDKSAALNLVDARKAIEKRISEPVVTSISPDN
jgi:zeaxanthin glucosyltransferase